MAKAVTAYVSGDGAIHLDREEAEFADYSAELREDVSDFMRQSNIEDSDGALARMLCKWDLWKLGGFEGWRASLLPQMTMHATVPGPVSGGCEVAAPAGPTSLPTGAAAKNAAAPKPVAPKRAYRRHIGVMGLDRAQHADMEREFGAVFRLTMLDGDQAKKGWEKVKGCHKVIALDKFTPRVAIASLRSRGVEPLVLPGAASLLRETLTSMYVET
jgi:hypothetical protein